jgi:hypothetical protein
VTFCYLSFPGNINCLLSLLQKLVSDGCVCGKKGEDRLGSGAFCADGLEMEVGRFGGQRGTRTPDILLVRQAL